MNESDDWTNFKSILSFIADVVSILGVTLASILTGFYAIFRKNRDYVALKVSLFLAYLFKATLILFIAAFIAVSGYELASVLFFAHGAPFLLRMVPLPIISATSLVAIWLLGSLIWTFSTRHIIGFINSLGFRFDKPIPKLEVLNARYGTEMQNIDLTNILTSLIVNNKLEVTASNDLGGDPHHGLLKKLVVQYRYNSKLKSESVDEGQILKLPNPEEI